MAKLQLIYTRSGVNNPVLVVDDNLGMDIVWVNPSGIYSYCDYAVNAWGVKELKRCCGKVLIDIPNNLWFEKLDGQISNEWFIKKNDYCCSVETYHLFSIYDEVIRVSDSKTFSGRVITFEETTIKSYLLNDETSKKTEKFEIIFKFEGKPILEITAPKIEGIIDIIKDYLNYKYALRGSKNILKIKNKYLLIENFEEGKITTIIEYNNSQNDGKIYCFNDLLIKCFDQLKSNEEALKFLKRHFGIILDIEDNINFIFFEDIVIGAYRYECGIATVETTCAPYAYKLSSIKTALKKRIKEQIPKSQA